MFSFKATITGYPQVSSWKSI